MQAYYEILTGEDHSKKIEAAKAWSTWEGSTVRLLQDENFISDFSDDKFAEAFARIECHYFINNIFLEDNFILKNIKTIESIPTKIIQGRYDVVCPVRSAWDQNKRLKNSEIIIVYDAGHSMSEKGISIELIKAVKGIENL